MQTFYEVDIRVLHASQNTYIGQSAKRHSNCDSDPIYIYIMRIQIGKHNVINFMYTISRKEDER